MKKHLHGWGTTNIMADSVAPKGAEHGSISLRGM